MKLKNNDCTDRWTLQQYFIWYLLWLKSWCKRKTSWLQLAVLFLLAVSILEIHWPTADNTSVGLYSSEDPLAMEITNLLINRESIFTFILYDNEKKLQRDITSGILDCGFVFNPEFETNINSDKPNEQILFLCTPSFTKGMVARETLYSAFMEIYSEKILLKQQNEIFVSGQDEKSIQKMLSEKYDYYLDNSELFQVITKEIAITDTRQEIQSATTSDMQKNALLPLQGTLGLVLFVMIWMAYGRKFESHGRGLYIVLNRNLRNLYEYLGLLAAVTIPGFFVYIIVISSDSSRGPLYELLYILLFLFICCLWVLCIGKKFKNSTSIAAWIFSLTALQLVLCPVIINLAAYVPAFKYLRYLIPLGWYL